MADGKDSAVPLMKNVVNRMSQQRAYFQETIVSLRQRLSHIALCTGLPAMTEKEGQRKGKENCYRRNFTVFIYLLRRETSANNLTQISENMEHFLTFTVRFPNVKCQLHAVMLTVSFKPSASLSQCIQPQKVPSSGAL